MIAGADGNSGMLRQYSLSDFELIRVIGRGSYAKVLMVELKRTKRIYAMKVIKKALVTDDEDIDWVQTEKHVFETASNHPFLVGLHSCFQTPSRLFFVIEFVRGGDLMFHMQRKQRLEEDHARFYAAEISLALNFLHQKGEEIHWINMLFHQQNILHSWLFIFGPTQLYSRKNILWTRPFFYPYMWTLSLDWSSKTPFGLNLLEGVRTGSESLNILGNVLSLFFYDSQATVNISHRWNFQFF